MMTASLHVRRLRARYHVAAGAGAVKERLDRVLRGGLGPALDAAIAALDVSDGEEVCVRTVPVRVRVALAAPDEAIAAAWSGAVARALRERLATGDGVVRFRSRAHALVDLLAGVAEGDLERAWAWRQLGLWDGTSGGAAAVHALAAMPEAAPAALTAIARAGAIAALARRVDAGGWCAVAERALAASGVDASVLDTPGGGPRRGGAGHAFEREARHIAGRAQFAAAIAAAVGGGAGPARARRAVAALAALAEEPAALRRAGAALVDALADTIARASADEIPAAAPSPPAPRRTADAPSTALARRGADAGAPIATPEGRRTAGAGAGPGRAPARDGAVADGDARPLPSVRRSGRTRAGGLLYLLHVVAELGVVDTLCADGGALASRPLRWALHALALALLPVEARDPAALAFCGLAPGDDPPDRGAPPATEPESAQLAATAADVAERLRARLRRDEEAVRAVLLETCRRDAEIVADPAWIEVRLSLEDVDTRVRRAGLDLDPGWLPWLGCVVRFVHA